MVNFNSPKPSKKIIEIDNNFNNYKFNTISSDLSTDSSGNTAIVIDNGSFRVKAGFSGEIAPRMSFAPIVATTSVKDTMLTLTGNNITNQLPMTSNDLNTPFNKGIVSNLAVEEHIFDYVFDGLCSDKKEIDLPVLITEPLENPTRGATAELLFEYYKTPSICFAVDFLLSHFYNSFKSSSEPTDEFLKKTYTKINHIIVSAGHEYSHIAPIINGQFQPKSTIRVPVGGKTITNYLNETLKLRYPRYTSHFTENMRYEIITKALKTADNFEDVLFKENQEEVIVKYSKHQVESDDYKRFMNDCNQITSFEDNHEQGENGRFEFQTFRQLEIARQALQIFKCIIRRKEDTSLEYALFLRLIDEFRFQKEQEFQDMTLLLEHKIKTTEEKFTNLSVQKTTHYDRVKTRERSRKQKQLGQKKLSVLSGIDEPVRDSRTKYWDCSQLIYNEVLTYEDLKSVVMEFKEMCKTDFQICLANECYTIPEVFFKPNLVGFKGKGGIGDALSAVSRVGLNDVFVTGGAALINNFSNRIRSESVSHFQCNSNHDVVSVQTADDPVYDAWRGGSVFAGSDLFVESCVSLSDYEEMGAEAVLKNHLFAGECSLLSEDVMEDEDITI